MRWRPSGCTRLSEWKQQFRRSGMLSTERRNRSSGFLKITAPCCFSFLLEWTCKWLSTLIIRKRKKEGSPNRWIVYPRKRYFSLLVQSILVWCDAREDWQYRWTAKTEAGLIFCGSHFKGINPSERNRQLGINNIYLLIPFSILDSGNVFVFENQARRYSSFEALKSLSSFLKSKAAELSHPWEFLNWRDESQLYAFFYRLHAKESSQNAWKRLPHWQQK